MSTTNRKLRKYDSTGTSIDFDCYTDAVTGANYEMHFNSTAAFGTQGNAWSAANVAINGFSNVIDTGTTYNLALFGNSSVASTLTINVSQDNVNWYATSLTVAANGNFYFTFSTPARFVKVQSSAAATITATLAGKIG